jgi:hypothetical protein
MAQPSEYTYHRKTEMFLWYAEVSGSSSYITILQEDEFFPTYYDLFTQGQWSIHVDHVIPVNTLKNKKKI